MLHDNLKPRHDPRSPLLHGVKDEDSLNNLLPLHVVGVVESCDEHGYLSLSLVKPRFDINVLQRLTREYYTGWTYETEVAVGDFYVHKTTLDECFRCRVLDVKDKVAFVRYLDMDYEQYVEVKDLYRLEDKFIQGDYQYSLVVPAYTMSKKTVSSVKCLHSSSLQAGMVVDILVLHVNIRCLVLVAPHRFGHFTFQAQMLRYYNALADKTWLEFLSGKEFETPYQGSCYPQMKLNISEGFSFGLVTAVDGLDSVYIRDLKSCIMVYYIHRRLQEVFACSERRSKFELKKDEELFIDQPSVFHDFTASMYYRCKLTRVTGHYFDAVAIDYPNKKFFGVTIDDKVLYRLPEGLHLPTTTYPVKLVNEVKCEEQQRYTQLLQGLLEENTPVTYSMFVKSGMVDMRLLSNANVLDEIRYHDRLARMDGWSFGRAFNKSRGNTENFKSSLSAWEAMQHTNQQERSAFSDSKKTKRVSSMFENSMLPRKPGCILRRNPVQDAMEVERIFSIDYNCIYYRTFEQEEEFKRLLVDMNKTVTFPDMYTGGYTVGKCYLIRSRVDRNLNVHRVKVVEVNNDEICYQFVDSGATVKQSAFDLRKCTRSLSDFENFAFEKVPPLVEGPFRMGGTVMDDKLDKYKVMKMTAGLRNVLEQIGTAYVKKKDDTVYIYSRDGEDVNESYFKTVNKI
ncbi:unnamed protein product [Bursaphelenchus okinawaensis]|uniref:Tudor domain-containing protein n=1 Tax=Bursaphelenchus okinawaensis TaxID=465554 RepID=A0A811K8M7_9BILA|nr:unnamed protein product [Bursaphelenchus okinawaensis]CAG9094039.1 unnamed protein product [Bursaphelenchus okinawaensis]